MAQGIITAESMTGLNIRLSIAQLAAVTVKAKAKGVDAAQYVRGLVVADVKIATPATAGAKAAGVTKTAAQVKAERKARRDARKSRTADALKALAAKMSEATQPKA